MLGGVNSGIGIENGKSCCGNPVNKTLRRNYPPLTSKTHRLQHPEFIVGTPNIYWTGTHRIIECVHLASPRQRFHFPQLDAEPFRLDALRSTSDFDSLCGQPLNLFCGHRAAL